MELDRQNKTVKGYFSSARYGKSTFSGKLVKSNLSVYSQVNVEGLTLDQLVGSHAVKVGNYEMTLTIGKRTEDRTVYEASLVNDNALMSFSKVSISEKGIISLVDSNNQRKLTLGVTDFSGTSPVLVGQFLNASQAKILEVVSK